MAAYYGTLNALWFSRKYRDQRIRALLTAYFLLLLCRVALVDVLKRRQPRNVSFAIRGFLDGWLLRPDGCDPLLGEPLWSQRQRRS